MIFLVKAVLGVDRFVDFVMMPPIYNLQIMESRGEGVDELPDFAMSIADQVVAQLVERGEYLFVYISNIATAVHEICSAVGVDGLNYDVSDHVNFLREFIPETDLVLLMEWFGFRMDEFSVEYATDFDSQTAQSSLKSTLAKKRQFNSYLRGKYKVS